MSAIAAAGVTSGVYTSTYTAAAGYYFTADVNPVAQALRLMDGQRPLRLTTIIPTIRVLQIVRRRASL